MASVTCAPLRILCIHGYRQNSVCFREKTGALRKLMKKQVDLVYINAPHVVREVTDDPNQEHTGEPVAGRDDPRGWWFSDPQARSFSAHQMCRESLGLDESIVAVREAVRNLGPFDGILGFSQGAALAAILCSLQEQNHEPDFSFRFVVLVAGFRSTCEEHHRFYSAPLCIPSLHVFGLDDKVIPDHMSRDLLPVFQDTQVLTHAGGHFVPAASTHRQTYQDFLKRFECENKES